ncbi:hypothetical protein F5Y08DRAFT_11428 [Xylaria arbuscula]|nr:hypothetical protein F5Y08DRAFT_11428 [Xylaria arbuscula]
MDWPVVDLISHGPSVECHDPTLTFPYDALSEEPLSDCHRLTHYDHGDNNETLAAVDESLHALSTHGDGVSSTYADLLATELGDLSVVNLDGFLLQNGGWRPPVPCSYCRRMRFQCFVLQTTDANPNPIESCSTCVALFRDCSLAERGKRDPSQFETSAPVIGHLHGVNEEGSSHLALGSALPLAAPVNKRVKSHAVNKTRALRNWFACHLDDPYPTDEEKALLVEQSGLTRVQVVNWFTNARRRQRKSRSTSRGNTHFPHGSPMPQSSFATDMTPMERWRNSPPEEEPATTVAALAAAAEISDLLPMDHLFDSSSTHAYDGYSFSDDSTSNPYSLSQCGSSSDSASLQYSFSADGSDFASSVPQAADQLFMKRRGRKVTNHSLPSRDKDKRIYQCTFCRQGFKKKSDWLRHESSIHMLNLESWICAAPLPPDQPLTTWRIGETEPECTLCGHKSSDSAHMDSHEFEACAERNINERTFSRKDHLWQHLYKFHGCRKWEGWSPDLSTLQHVQNDVQSICGFCQAVMTSWG